MRGTLTLGALVAFLQYSQRFFRPISDMSEKFNVLQSAMASSERIFKLLDEPVVDRSRRRSRSPRPAPAARAHRRSITSGSPTTTATVRVVSGLGAAGRVLRGQAGRARRASSAPRVGQDDADQPAAAVLRRAARPDHRRRRRHPRARSRATCAGCSASCCRTCTCSPARSPTTSGSGTSRSTTSGCGAAARAVHADAFIERLPDGYAQRRSPSAARRCRSARSSCCRSRARWRSIRAS